MLISFLAWDLILICWLNSSSNVLAFFGSDPPAPPASAGRFFSFGPIPEEAEPLTLDGLEEEEEEDAGGFEPVDFRMAVPRREGPARAVLVDEGALINVGFFAVLVGWAGFAWTAVPDAEEGVDERAATPPRADGEGS